MTLVSSDSLNPMLVRDLRQGLRSSLFTLVFLCLQGGMAFFVVMGLISGEVSRRLVDTLMFGLVFFYVLGLPMIALFSLSPEFRENRIDLLKLTQMSARSLVWGKWFSLVTQGLLVIASLLPYLILTYFFGGVDLKGELEALGFLLVFSALLVSVCVALSCFDSAVFKVVVVLGLLFLSFAVFASSSGPGSGPAFLFGLFNYLTVNPGVSALLLLTVGFPLHWLLMEFGAYRLAPAAENHDTPQRLILFALIAVAGLAMVGDLLKPSPFLNDFTELFFYYGAFLAAWVLVFAAGTDPSPYPDAFRPFVRFGALGKFIGRTFLYPGWPSSAPFILLVSAFFAMLATAMASARGVVYDYHWFAATFLMLPPALLFPQALGLVLLGRSRFGGGTRYFVASTFCLLVFVVCGILNTVTSGAAYYLIACVLPPDAWFLIATGQLGSPVLSNAGGMMGMPNYGGPRSASDPALIRSALIIAGFMGMATMVFVCLRALRHWKHFTLLERRAANSAAPRRPGPVKTAGSADSAPPATRSGPTFSD